jgi:hypothetical protein
LRPTFQPSSASPCVNSSNKACHSRKLDAGDGRAEAHWAAGRLTPLQTCASDRRCRETNEPPFAGSSGSLHIAQIMGMTHLSLRVVFGVPHQYAHPPHSLALLRACRKRPSRCAAKKDDELPPRSSLRLFPTRVRNPDQRGETIGIEPNGRLIASQDTPDFRQAINPIASA